MNQNMAICQSQKDFVNEGFTEFDFKSHKSEKQVHKQIEIEEQNVEIQEEIDKEEVIDLPEHTQ